MLGQPGVPLGHREHGVGVSCWIWENNLRELFNGSAIYSRISSGEHRYFKKEKRKSHLMESETEQMLKEKKNKKRKVGFFFMERWRKGRLG